MGSSTSFVAAHLLNELFVDCAPAERVALRARRVLRLGDASPRRTACLILIEPALRETSRELLAVRDQLLSARASTSSRPASGPAPVPRSRSTATGATTPRRFRSHPRVDFSYLVLGAAPVPPAAHPLSRRERPPAGEGPPPALRLRPAGPPPPHPPPPAIGRPRTPPSIAPRAAPRFRSARRSKRPTDSASPPTAPSRHPHRQSERSERSKLERGAASPRRRQLKRGGGGGAAPPPMIK